MAFSATDIVLVTGGNGHVAQHVISQLLSYPCQPTVRATVRSSSSASTLSKAFSSFITSGKLEIIQIPDITFPSAFDSALPNVTHIAHVASPLIIGAVDTEKELLIPAIKGTTSVIEAAAKCPTMKGVVVTGSFAGVFDAMHGYRVGYEYGPEDWNPITYAEVLSPDFKLEKWPEKWRPYITYMASKKLSEETAWRIWKERGVDWDLSFILPTYIVGPHVPGLGTQGKAGLSFSNGLVWDAVCGQELPVMNFPWWVDVRDVATAHLEALQRREAGGKRFLMAAEGLTFSDMADIARKHLP